MLNRTREYWADHYAAEVTRDPDALSSALVKIAYGMVRTEGEYREAMANGSKDQKAEGRRNTVSAAAWFDGISNIRSGAALALSANPAEAAAVMQWDLVNPWARLYEMNSTHPLTALRVRELNQQVSAMHQSSRYQLPQDNRIRWGLFPSSRALGGSVPDQLRYAYHLVAVRLAHVSRCHVAPWYEARALDVYRRVLDSPHSLSLRRQLRGSYRWQAPGRHGGFSMLPER